MTSESKPICLDTSVVVRYLTDDPPEMASRAAILIDSTQMLAITAIVLVESAYVLTKVYGIDRSQVAEALSAMILRRNITVPHISKEFVVRALQLAATSGRVSFADAMIWAEARETDAPIATFDRRFPGEGLDLIEPK